MPCRACNSPDRNVEVSRQPGGGGDGELSGEGKSGRDSVLQAEVQALVMLAGRGRERSNLAAQSVRVPGIFLPSITTLLRVTVAPEWEKLAHRPGVFLLSLLLATVKVPPIVENVDP
jgi:hypothetical protein